MTLRDRLRAETESAHCVLDGRVSRFDLATAEGLAEFLAFHVRMLAVFKAQGPETDILAAMNDLQSRASEDLRLLGHPAAAPAPLMSAPVSSVALDYVFSGSRLGGAVLKRRWSALAAQRSLAQSLYFDAPSYGNLWQQFRARIETYPSHGSEADHIVRGARALLEHLARLADGPQLPQQHRALTASALFADGNSLAKGQAR